MEVEVRRRFLPALPAFARGSVLLLSLTAVTSEAALVRSVAVDRTAAGTAVVVVCDGEVAYRAGAADGGYLLELQDSELDARTPRLVPVADSLVDGVSIIAVPERRLVRIRIHHPDHVDASVEPGSRAGQLLVRLTRTMPGAPRPSIEPAPARRKPHEAVPAGLSARPLIVIDPGHGGKDPGARVWAGEYEKDIVLAIANMVAERLRKRLDVDVVMTRTTDVFVPLKERRAMVRKWNADLFVSIHANASGNAGASGVETYYARAGRSAPKAERGGAGVRSARAGRNAASPRLARSIQEELVRHLGMRYKAVRDLGVKEGRFYVLTDNDVPSVLVEAAFLTHREEGLRIRSESYRDMAAEGIVGGIANFLSTSVASPL